MDRGTAWTHPDKRLEARPLGEYVSYSLGLHLSPVVAGAAIAFVCGGAGLFGTRHGHAASRAQELDFYTVEPTPSGMLLKPSELPRPAQYPDRKAAHRFPDKSAAVGAYPKIAPEEKNGVRLRPDERVVSGSDRPRGSTEASSAQGSDKSASGDHGDAEHSGKDLHLLTVEGRADTPNDGFGVPVDARKGDDEGFPGLVGSVCFIPEGTRSLRDLGQCDPVSRVRARVLDVTPRDWTSSFPGAGDRLEWFSIDYSGKFHVSQGGHYGFRLLSDDGSLLSIDGKLVVDNDGLHSPASARGWVDLDPGQHQIHVQYYQGPRTEVALQLFVTPPGEPERIWTSDL